MSTLTTTQIITSAYRKTGNLSPTTAQKTSALEDLNSFLGILNGSGLLVPYRTKEDLTLTISTNKHTIGSGGDIGTVRPLKIFGGYIRDSNSKDYIIKADLTMEEYNSIIDKTTEGRPARMFYIPGYPLGSLYFDRATDYAYTLSLDCEKPITEIAIDTAFVIAEEYRLFLIYNLAVILASDKNVDLHPSILKIAKDTMKMVKRNNSIIEPAQIDPALTRPGVFDVYTGEII